MSIPLEAQRLALTCALALSLGLALAPGRGRAEELVPRKHYLYDAVDDVWYCIGSPLNCDFHPAP